MKIRKRRKASRKRPVKVKTVYRTRARKRRVRHSAPVMHRVKRRVRRRAGRMMGGMSGNKIKNIMVRGLVATAGAGLAVFVTNLILKALGAKIDASNKKWVFIGSAMGLGLLLPRFQFARKYAVELTTGAVAYSLIQLAGTNDSLKQYFNVAGAESEELDQIISNLNVQGEMNLLGARESGLLGAREMMGDLNLLGISEKLGALDDDGQEEYE